jgi:hypothetical protein
LNNVLNIEFRPRGCVLRKNRNVDVEVQDVPVIDLAGKTRTEIELLYPTRIASISRMTWLKGVYATHIGHHYYFFSSKSGCWIDAMLSPPKDP